jgi:hypothetical protein
MFSARKDAYPIDSADLIQGPPAPEGGGGAGNVTSPKQELERQLRSLRHPASRISWQPSPSSIPSPEKAAALLKAAGFVALRPEQVIRAGTRIRTRGARSIQRRG